MKRILLFAVATSVAAGCYAQHRSSGFRPAYTFAVGARAGATGATTGLQLKGFIGETVALDGIVGYWHGAPAATVLIEKHIPAFGVRGLRWFLGGGAHYTYRSGFNRWYVIDRRSYDYVDGGSGYGIDAVTGLEYKIPVAPIAFAIDIKPMAEFGSRQGFAAAVDPGLSVRFAF